MESIQRRKSQRLSTKEAVNVIKKSPSTKTGNGVIHKKKKISTTFDTPKKEINNSNSNSENTKKNLSEPRKFTHNEDSVSSHFTIKTPSDFSFRQSICSYGFYLMHPNKAYISNDTSNNQSFKRALRYGPSSSYCSDITITQISDNLLKVDVLTCPGSKVDLEEIEHQVKRMLRLDKNSPDLTNWWKLNPKAEKRKFGHLFRSPSLWEDMVKTITICNTRFNRSRLMNELLCSKISTFPNSFPSPKDVMKYTAKELQDICQLGYRGERVRRLAEDIETNKLDVSWYESPDRNKQEVENALMKLYGFGPFATNNVLHLLGYYESYAYDSETVRHFAEVHKKFGKLPEITKIAKKYYDDYKPYQFLAYWFELWLGYEARKGMISLEWGGNF